jgi:hypothetical protein
MSHSHTFSGSTRVVSGTFELTDVRSLLGDVVVEFPDGTNWVYRDVPQEVWTMFTEAKSAGLFLREELEQYRNGPA